MEMEPKLQTLFDSDRFVVVHTTVRREIQHYGGLRHFPPEHVFEVHDKVHSTCVLLRNETARAFESQIGLWQLNTPTEAEVEACLAGYADFGAVPMSIH